MDNSESVNPLAIILVTTSPCDLIPSHQELELKKFTADIIAEEIRP